MAEDVLYHPAAALRKKIDNLVDARTSDLVELFIEHLETDCSRVHLCRAVEDGRFAPETKGQDILTLLDWASDKSFTWQAGEDAGIDPITPEETAPAVHTGSGEAVDDERAAALAGFADLAFAQARADSEFVEWFKRIGELELYEKFPPSWGLDTAAWSQIFGDHDPVPTIDFHLSEFFDNDVKDRECRSISLSEQDIPIWRYVIEALSDIPWRIRIDEPELPKEQKVRALRAVLCLPEELGPTLTISDPDLCGIIELSPDWLTGRLIDWWVSSDILWTRQNDKGVNDVLPDQVALIYRILVRHLVDWPVMEDSQLEEQFSVTAEDIANLPSYLPTSGKSYERIVDAFWDATEFSGDEIWYRTSLTKAVYLARPRLFRNRFPFASNAILTLAELAHEDGYWLAHFCDAVDRPDQIFRYLSFVTSPVSDDPWIGRLQLIEMARNRKNAYENALEEMLRDGHFELARAWWAFFMASQSQMFSGFGLGSPESRGIIEIAERLLPDEGIERAFEFVRAMAADTKDLLDQRIMLDLLPKRSAKGEILELSPKTPDDFLAHRITREIWDLLHPETHQDLRDAEALWSRSFREMGAGRIDWGGLGVIYARAVEREMKAHLVPLLAALRAAGLIREGKRATIGSIAKACEEAKAGIAARKSEDPDHLGQIVSRLDDAFRQELGVITAIRNRAAHGDRSDPVIHLEFLALRVSIFEQGVFRTIVECGQSAS